MTDFIHWTLYIAAVLYAMAGVGFLLQGNKPMFIAYISYAISNVALAQLA